MDRRLVLEPGKDQVLRVQSGDRLYFSLAEEPGCTWACDCADGDVEVAIHPNETGRVKVSLHVHRGYDGPSDVVFRCSRCADGQIVKSFVLGLYKGTGDFAAWK